MTAIGTIWAIVAFALGIIAAIIVGFIALFFVFVALFVLMCILTGIGYIVWTCVLIAAFVIVRWFKRHSHWFYETIPPGCDM